MSDKLDKLKNLTFQGFIRANYNADLTKLLFAGNKPEVDIKLAVDQILSRRKAKAKLSSWLDKEGVILPPPLSIEQASSEITSDYKSLLFKGEKLVDLTGGMGVDTIAMSESFTQTIYVEQDAWLCEVFQHNISLLKISKIDVINKQAEEFLKKFSGKAVFFIDPARRDSLNKKVFRFEDCTPDITKILFLLKDKAEKVLVKASPMIDITQGVRALKYVNHIHVLSIKNDCKEVLFELDFDQTNDNPIITNINYTDQGEENFQFKLKEEKDSNFGQVKRYIYEPNASIMKSGGYSSIANAFPVVKLNVNTHLFTSEILIDNFPGRKFIVLKDSLTKDELALMLPSMKANIITRNYPLKPEELKRKYKLKDGGDHFLIGYKDLNEKPKLMIASRLT